MIHLGKTVVLDYWRNISCNSLYSVVSSELCVSGDPFRVCGIIILNLLRYHYNNHTDHKVLVLVLVFRDYTWWWCIKMNNCATLWNIEYMPPKCALCLVLSCVVNVFSIFVWLIHLISHFPIFVKCMIMNLKIGESSFPWKYSFEWYVVADFSSDCYYVRIAWSAFDGKTKNTIRVVLMFL